MWKELRQYLIAFKFETSRELIKAVEALYIDSIRDLLLNWNKFGRGSRNLGDLLYLMNNEWGVCFEIVRPGTTPESMSSTGITQG